MSLFAPTFGGSFVPRLEGRVFLDRFARRVEAGLLMGRPHFRSRYSVVNRSSDELVIRSNDFWTDFNVGLNDITLRLGRDGAIEYRVTFWRWLRGGVVFCGAMGVAFLVMYFLPLPEPWNITAQLKRYPPSWEPFFWGSLVWWGVIWPWVLAAAHRGPANRFLRHILGEVDAAER